jgi:predicted ester cyclase
LLVGRILPVFSFLTPGGPGGATPSVLAGVYEMGSRTGWRVMSQHALADVAKAPIVAYDDVIAAWKGWATAFPDSKATFDASHVSGNTVILEVTWRGTHTGPLESPTGDIPATGKTIEMRACQVVDAAGGRARSIRQYLDMATMMTQLGLTAAGA